MMSPASTNTTSTAPINAKRFMNPSFADNSSHNGPVPIQRDHVSLRRPDRANALTGSRLRICPSVGSGRYEAPVAGALCPLHLSKAHAAQAHAGRGDAAVPRESTGEI